MHNSFQLCRPFSRSTVSAAQGGRTTRPLLIPCADYMCNVGM